MPTRQRRTAADGGTQLFRMRAPRTSLPALAASQPGISDPHPRAPRIDPSDRGNATCGGR